MGIISTIEKDLDSAPVKLGETTKNQVGGGLGTIGGVGVAGMASSLPGYGEPPLGTFNLYRKIAGHPTVAIAMMAATAAVYGSRMSIEADDTAPAGAQEFIKKTFTPLWPTIINDGLLAIKYGYQVDEKIYTYDRDGRVTLSRLKQLNPDLNEIVVDEHGGYLGVRNNGVPIPARKTWLYSNEMEAGNLYGRARLENVRDPWHGWMSTFGRSGQYIDKVAAVIPLIKYPEGSSKDATGREVSNFQMAQQVLANLTKGHGIAMPNNLAKWADDLTGNGVDIGQLAAWQLSFLEPGSDMLASIITKMRYLDSNMLRGMFVPEGTVSDGQVGSRARTQSNVDITIAMSQRDLDGIRTGTNKHLVNDLLALNWGPSAVDTVRVKTEPLDDEKAAMVRRITEKVLTTEPTPQLLLETVDVTAMIKSQDLPEPKAGRQVFVMPGTTQPDPNAPPSPTATPVGPDGKTITESGAPAAGGVQTDTALNGAQITSAVDVCTRARDGSLAPEAATQLLIAVGLTPEQAKAMVDAQMAMKAKPVDATQQPEATP